MEMQYAVVVALNKMPSSTSMVVLEIVAEVDVAESLVENLVG